MTDGKCKKGRHDHWPIEDHERRFIVGSLGLEATRKFDNTIDASDSDRDSSNTKSCKLST